MVVRGPLDDRRLSAQTQWVSIGASEQPHRTRHTALGCIPGLAHPDGSSCIFFAASSFRWRWMRMQVRLSALLACTSSKPLPSALAQPTSERSVNPPNNRHVRALSPFHFSVGLYLAGRQRSLVHAARANLNLRFGGPTTLPCVSPSCHFLKGFTSSLLEAGCFVSFLSRKRQRGCQTLTRRMLRPLLALCTVPRH